MARRYLIAGSGGMLGTALQDAIAERGERCMAPAEGELDITETAAIARAVFAFVGSLGPGDEGVLINAAAYTNVERAEDDAEKAYAVNNTGAGSLAVMAREANIRFVHVSTDFVFDGRKDGPYAEDDPPNPLSVYGASKLAGERSVAWENPEALIVRTAWVFGENGMNFPTKIVAAARERGEVTVVDDEVGCPTYTPDLARGILQLLDAQTFARGLFHLTNRDETTRYDLAVEVLRQAGLSDVPVKRAKAADFPTKAQRPLNSRLDCSKAGSLGVTMPAWQDAVARFVSGGTAHALS